MAVPPTGSSSWPKLRNRRTSPPRRNPSPSISRRRRSAIPLKARRRPSSASIRTSRRDTPQQTIGVKGEPIEDGERDPDTIAEEQRRRSDEIQAAGVERWKYDHDTRSEEEKGPFVAAPHAEVEGQRRVEHHESRK